MRQDITKDDDTDEYDILLDDETVKRIQDQLKLDPKKRIMEIGSILRSIIIWMAVIAIITVVYYYGTIMYKTYQFGENYRSRYDNIIKESE